MITKPVILKKYQIYPELKELSLAKGIPSGKSLS
jgi:hypothetical protein